MIEQNNEPRSQRLAPEQFHVNVKIDLSIFILSVQRYKTSIFHLHIHTNLLQDSLHLLTLLLMFQDDKKISRQFGL